jgi:hypothetical protein
VRESPPERIEWARRTLLGVGDVLGREQLEVVCWMAHMSAHAP